MKTSFPFRPKEKQKKKKKKISITSYWKIDWLYYIIIWFGIWTTHLGFPAAGYAKQSKRQAHHLLAKEQINKIKKSK